MNLVINTIDKTIDLNAKNILLCGDNAKEETVKFLAACAKYEESSDVFLFDFEGDFEDYKSSNKSNLYIIPKSSDNPIGTSFRKIEKLEACIKNRLKRLQEGKYISIEKYNEANPDKKFKNKIYVLYCAKLNKDSRRLLNECIQFGIKVGITIVLVLKEETDTICVELKNRISTIIYCGGLDRKDVIRILGNNIEDDKAYIKHNDNIPNLIPLYRISYHDVTRELIDSLLYKRLED